MSTIISGLASSLRPTFAILNDLLYIFLGNARSLCWDGVTQTLMGILPPTSSALTIASSGSGTISAVTGYKYNYAWYNSIKGITSDPYPLAGLTQTGPMTSVTSITISSFPATAPDAQVTGIRVYRTTDGGSVFYYSGEIAIGTQVFTDTNTDAMLGEEESVRNNVAPAVKYGISAKRRLWMAGCDRYDTGTVTVSSGSMTVTGLTTQWTTGLRTRYFQVANSSRLYEIDSVSTEITLTLTQAYGEIGSAAALYSIYGENNRIFFSEIGSDDVPLPESTYLGLDYGDFIDLPVDGDEIFGLGQAKAYTLLAFKRHKVYAISGTSKSDFNLTLVHPYGGTCSHWTIANDDLGYCYYFDAERGVFKTDGVNFVSISKDKIDSYLIYYINTDYSALSHGVFYPKRSWYMLWVCSPWATLPDICLIYDAVTGEWYQREISATCSAIILNTTTNESEVWIGDSSGFIHKLDMDGTLNQSVTSGTTRGTVIGTQGATTLVDTTATFFTSASGLKGCYVTLKGGTGVGQRRLISSNTSSQLTVTTDWVVTPITADTTYCIGGFDSYWYSKWIDLNSGDFKRFYDFLMTFLNQKDSTSVKVSFFTDLVSDSGTVAVTNGSPNVTGTSTLFTSDDKGKVIFFSGHNAEYVISNVTSQTAIVLNKTYAGTTASGSKYSMELFSTTIDMNTGFDTIIDMAARARYIKFRIGLRDSDRAFQIYSCGYTADNERLT